MRGNKKKERKENSNSRVPNVELVEPRPTMVRLHTSAGFFLAVRKGKFPPVTDKTNGFGASLGLQRL